MTKATAAGFQVAINDGIAALRDGISSMHRCRPSEHGRSSRFVKLISGKRASSSGKSIPRADCCVAPPNSQKKLRFERYFTNSPLNWLYGLRGGGLNQPTRCTAVLATFGQRWGEGRQNYSRRSTLHRLTSARRLAVCRAREEGSAKRYKYDGNVDRAL
jgi:hypothetical protein